uniref:Protein Wnt n=1 Tax=Panagrolaimus sp. PS1159 TaxID=55785 RepID=A0AC35GWV7_9BILA
MSIFNFWFFSTVIGLYISLILLPVNGIKWLAINNLRSNWIDPNQCPATVNEKEIFGFVQYQSELCRRMTDLMPYVKNAAKETIEMCQEIFKEHRWNCSTIKKAPNFGSDLTKGTKEQAFVYALSSAAIVHSIAKACSKGELDYCKCGIAQNENIIFSNNDETSTNELPTDSPSINSEMDENAYRWQGCSDNIDYGISASREWADATWKSKLRMSRDLGPAGEFIWDEDNSILTTPAMPRMHEIKGITEGKKIIMNQQNNNVGRQIVVKSQFQKCKCHGVSSSCQVQTCWNTLPPFKAIADGLKIKYLQAQQLTTKSHFLNPNIPPPTDLIYLRPSSNYCELTHDRECNATTNPTSINSCSNLCCERGHYAITVPITEHCHCKYVHCCYVKCKSCLFYVNKSFCN